MKGKLLGIGSFFCSIYVLVLIGTIMIMPMFVDMEGEIPVPLRPVVVVAMVLLIASVLGTCFLIIYDIVHIVKNPLLSDGGKAGWICAIWFLNIFVIPIYWLKHQRDDRRTKDSAVRSEGAPSVVQ